MRLLGGKEWKTFAQIKAYLCAEDGIGAGAGAVGLELSMFEDVPQQIEVLNHRGKSLTTKCAREKEIKPQKTIYVVSKIKTLKELPRPLWQAMLGHIKCEVTSRSKLFWRLATGSRFPNVDA